MMSSRSGKMFCHLISFSNTHLVASAELNRGAQISGLEIGL
jgi:hypothetical protein